MNQSPTSVLVDPHAHPRTAPALKHRYRAFLSYAHEDSLQADRIFNALDSYHVPRELVDQSGRDGAVPKTLHPVFRDRLDMKVGGLLSDRVRSALAESAFLVVVCSPRAADPERYVAEEIELFIELNPHDWQRRLVPVVIDGEPDSEDPSQECLPILLRGTGIVAANVRDVRMPGGRRIGEGFKVGISKVRASLLGLEPDVLLKRELQRARFRAVALATAAALGVVLTVLAVMFASIAEKRASQLQDAVNRSFAQRASELGVAGEVRPAIRFALAGQSLAPANEADNRAVLARAIFAAGDALATLQHDAAVTRVSFASDGKHAFSADAAGGVHSWRVSDGTLRWGMKGHAASVSALVAGPDGLLATAAEDGSIRVWRQADGSAVVSPPGHTKAVRALRFTPDGRYLISAGDSEVPLATSQEEAMARDGGYAIPPGMHERDVRRQGKVVVWSVPAGDQVGELPGLAGDATCLDLQNDGRLAVVGLKNGSGVLFDPSSGRVVGSISDYDQPVTACGFSALGAFVASASGRITALRTSGESASFLGHGSGAIAARGHKDAKRLFSTGADQVLRSWDPGSARQQWILPLSGFAVDRLEISPLLEPEVPGQLRGPHYRIALANRDGGLWLARSDSNASPTRLAGHAGKILDIAFSSDGKLLLSAGSEGQARLWSSRDRLAGERVGLQHGPLGQMEFLEKEPETLFTTGSTPALALWNAVDGSPVISREVADPAPFNAGHRQVNLELGRVVTVSTSGELKVRDLHSDRVISRHALAKGRRLIAATREHGQPSPQVLLVAGTAGDWHWLDLESGRLHKGAAAKSDVKWTHWALTPDAHQVLAVDDRGDATLWRRADGTRLAHRMIGVPARMDPRLDAQGTQVAVALANRQLVVLDLARELAQRSGPVLPYVADTLLWLPNDQLVAGTRDGSMHLVAMHNASLVWSRPAFHKGGHEQVEGGASITAFAIAPGAMLGASGNTSGEVQLWDPRDGAVISMLHPMPGGAQVSALRFSPDASRLWVGASSGALRWHDVKVLSSNVDELSRLACTSILEPGQRRFQPPETGDALVIASWPSGRALCPA